LSALLNQLLIENVLALVAHPDDESIGLGTYFQLCRKAHLLFLTSDQVGQSKVIVEGESAVAHSVRELEAEAAVRLVPNVAIVGFERFPNRALCDHLPQAAGRIETTLRHVGASFLLTHAFEGGHPDHDCCSFLANRVSRLVNIPVIEFPVYSGGPRSIVQGFSDAEGVIRLIPTDTQRSLKDAMFRAHASQSSVMRRFSASRDECFREQPLYDYYVPPWTEYYVDVSINRVVDAFKSFDLQTQYRA
jgi:N-acetylglucosamine malate deacetylase 2